MNKVKITRATASGFQEAFNDSPIGNLIYNLDTKKLCIKTSDTQYNIINEYVDTIGWHYVGNITTAITEYPSGYDVGSVFYMAVDSTIDGVFINAGSLLVKMYENSGETWYVIDTTSTIPDWISCKGISVQPGATSPIYVGNKYLGSFVVSSNSYIPILKLSTTKKSFMTGTLLIKGQYLEVITFSIDTLNGFESNLNFSYTGTELDIEFGIVTIGTNNYLCLHSFENVPYDIFFSGWADNFSTLPIISDQDITSSNYSNLDDNTPNLIPDSLWTDVVLEDYDYNGIPTITSAYNNYDFTSGVPLYVRVVKGSTSRTLSCSEDTEYKKNLFYACISDVQKPVYLNLENMTHYGTNSSDLTFYNKNGLYGLNLPSGYSCEYMNIRYAVEYCQNLVYLKLPANLEETVYNCLNNLPKVSYLEIPATVDEIHYYFFRNATGLKTIKILKTDGYYTKYALNPYDGSFTGLPSDFKILVPSDLLDTYQNVFEYTDFSNHFEAYTV